MPFRRERLGHITDWAAEGKVMTCLSCRHSIGTDGGIWCQSRHTWAVRRCERFEYEPGTDEGERT
jgi:hypothetical protein